MPFTDLKAFVNLTYFRGVKLNTNIRHINPCISKHDKGAAVVFLFRRADVLYLKEITWGELAERGLERRKSHPARLASLALELDY